MTDVFETPTSVEGSSGTQRFDVLRLDLLGGFWAGALLGLLLMIPGDTAYSLAVLAMAFIGCVILQFALAMSRIDWEAIGMAKLCLIGLGLFAVLVLALAIPPLGVLIFGGLWLWRVRVLFGREDFVLLASSAAMWILSAIAVLALRPHPVALVCAFSLLGGIGASGALAAGYRAARLLPALCEAATHMVGLILATRGLFKSVAGMHGHVVGSASAHSAHVHQASGSAAHTATATSPSPSLRHIHAHVRTIADGNPLNNLSTPRGARGPIAGLTNFTGTSAPWRMGSRETISAPPIPHPRPPGRQAVRVLCKWRHSVEHLETPPHWWRWALQYSPCRPLRRCDKRSSAGPMVRTESGGGCPWRCGSCSRFGVPTRSADRDILPDWKDLKLYGLLTGNPKFT